MIEEERLILVDPDDRPSGEGAKLDVHRRGLLHRAFSIFIWNDSGEMLLQQRAAGKYHSAGLWTNACCGHPRVAEGVTEAAHRRLYEELGMSAELAPIGQYSYRAELPNALIENEFVHLYAGLATADPVPNPEEVAATTWLSPEALLADVERDPDAYTAWFRLYLADISDRILSRPAIRRSAQSSNARNDR